MFSNSVLTVLATLLLASSVGLASLKTEQARTRYFAVFCGSIALYLLTKLVFASAFTPLLGAILSIVFASETLAAALMVLFFVSWFRGSVDSRSLLVLALPALEAATRLAVLFSGHDPEVIESIAIFVGQAALLVSTAAGLLFLKLYWHRYEQESADNKRLFAIMFTLPVLSMTFINLLWIVSDALQILTPDLNSMLFGTLLLIMLTGNWCYTAMRQRQLLVYSHDTSDIQADITENRSHHQARRDFSRIDAIMREERHYIDSNLTLNSLARRIGMNRSYVSKAINIGYGQNFSRYVNHLRVEESTRQLVQSDRSILQIAFDCGFNSKATFNRVFKTETGLAPIEYRRSKPAMADSISIAPNSCHR